MRKSGRSEIEQGGHGQARLIEKPGEDPVLGNYFVSAYPPFGCWGAENLAAFRDCLDGPAGGEPLGLYVHIPFCLRRCDYCYYRCYDDRSAEMEPYVSALLWEMERYASTSAIRDRGVDFVYIGGGTPSMLTLGQIKRLLAELQRFASWAEAREVTFECAPKTVTDDKLAALKAGGVTRLSIGAQQLDDRILELNGRIHRVADFEDAWRIAGRVGFEVLNVDLIAGLVGESDGSFFDSLERLLEKEPDSVTIYLLEVPLNTPLARAIRSPEPPPALPSWAEKRDRLERAFARLEDAGYSVRSAYTAVRDPDRRSFLYQDEQYRGVDVLGLGVSSFSYLGGWHQQNAADLDDYLELIESGSLPLGRAYALEPEERLVREFVLQLKLGGVDLDSLERKFGAGACERFSAALEDFARRGWLVRSPGAVRMTRSGLIRVDQLLESFYLPRHQGVGYW